MAIITGVSLSIDIAKLKQELEQSGVLKVLSITPTATGFQCEIINADNLPILSSQEAALAESIINSHQDQQKRKLQVKEVASEVYDATNKLFVDNKINDIMGPNANAALDTLMELSTALNNDSNFATTIATQINQLDTDITSLQNDVVSLQQADQLLATSIQQSTQTVNDNLTNNIQLVDNRVTQEETVRASADTNLQNQIDNLSVVATSGSYSDLQNLPALFSGDYEDLTNKPTLFGGDYDDLTNKPNLSAVAISGDYSDLLNAAQLIDVSNKLDLLHYEERYFN
jgi:myosin heavy subunit